MSDHPALLRLPILSFQGSPAEMGESFGEQCREEIQRLTAIRLAAARQFTVDHSGRQWPENAVMEMAAACLPISESWDSQTHEELLGIARGANLAPEALFMMQGLTDIRDHMAFYKDAESEGCSSFIIERERAEGGRVLAGQTWDLETSNMDFVVLVRRRPDNAPETVSLTLTGCLSLIGLNSEGFAIGTTNQTLSETRPGIHYLHLIHRLLRSRNVAEAVPLAREAPRMAAHYYYMADASGQSVGIECSARSVRLFHPQQGRLIRCNHVLDPELQRLEVSPPTESSCFRQRHLEALVDGHPGPITPADLKHFLSDHEGGASAICRHRCPPQDVSTNACVIMSPETGEIYACRGQAHAGEWEHLSVR